MLLIHEKSDSMLAGSLTTHSTGLAISLLFINNVGGSPVNSSVRWLYEIGVGYIISAMVRWREVA